MGQGIFSGTFYVLQEPINIQLVNVRLNIVQTGLIDNILFTEWMQCLRHELGGIANSLIYHKDHYKLIPNSTLCHYQPLIQHSNIFIILYIFPFSKKIIYNVILSKQIYFQNVILTSSNTFSPPQPTCSYFKFIGCIWGKIPKSILDWIPKWWWQVYKIIFYYYFFIIFQIASISFLYNTVIFMFKNITLTFLPFFFSISFI